jgi:hypothetical protein
VRSESFFIVVIKNRKKPPPAQPHPDPTPKGREKERREIRSFGFGLKNKKLSFISKGVQSFIKSRNKITRRRQVAFL